MEDSNHRLHSVALSDTEENKKISNDTPITNEMDVYKIYDDNDCLLCKCLDWCSWCSNISYKKSDCCEQNVVCFMCCCSITFE